MRDFATLNENISYQSRPQLCGSETLPKGVLCEIEAIAVK